MLSPSQIQPDPIDWTPLPGPQRAALESEADELLYGGAAGGGKTDLLLGAAGTQHYRSVIFRRVFPELRGIIERSRELYNANNSTRFKDSYNESLHIWRLASGRIIEFAAIQHEKNKEDQRGRPRDFYGWDEVTEFSENQFRFVNAWNRTTRKDQRCRVIATANPPMSPQGEWIIPYWAPWLDDQHPNPAQPGELRWFAQVDGKDVEVESGAPFEHKGETIRPRSRTFIPARLSDNPYLEDTGYRAVLQGLPEPLRSQMLEGDFRAGLGTHPWQVIPTEWVKQAQARWKPDGRPDTVNRTPFPLSAVGVDSSRGGKDETVFSPRFGTWFGELEVHEGTDAVDGPWVVGEMLRAVARWGGGKTYTANIDAIGIGSSVLDHARAQIGDRANAVIFSEAAKDDSGNELVDRTETFGFVNMRAYAYWHLREILDPDTGDNIALPPDSKLLSDLVAPRFEMRTGRLLVESKEDIAKRLGRSTDRGDAVVLAALELPQVDSMVYGFSR